MNKKQLFANIVLSFSAVIAALALGEVFLRSFYKEKVVLFPRYTTDVQYGEFTIRRLRPNSEFWHTSVDGSWKFITNAQGFRNEKGFARKKSSGVLRVLSLGDSHTQGMEVRQERTFSAVAERYMRGEGTDVEVINAGVSGFSTAEALVFLENEGVKYHPDMVVLGFFANDLQDNIKSGIFALTEDGLIVKKKKHIPGVEILNVINQFGVFRWLSENSYIYSFTFNSVWNHAKRLLLGREKAKLVTEYAIPMGQVDEYQLDLTAKLIERMYEFCQRHNIKLLILDIPVVSKEAEIRSSVPAGLYETLRNNSDFFIYSKDVLDQYRNVTEFHVAHGDKHISEFTHLLFGMEVARALSGPTEPQSMVSRKR